MYNRVLPAEGITSSETAGTGGQNGPVFYCLLSSAWPFHDPSCFKRPRLPDTSLRRPGKQGGARHAGWRPWAGKTAVLIVEYRRGCPRGVDHPTHSAKTRGLVSRSVPTLRGETHDRSDRRCSLCQVAGQHPGPGRAWFASSARRNPPCQPRSAVPTQWQGKWSGGQCGSPDAQSFRRRFLKLCLASSTSRRWLGPRRSREVGAVSRGERSASVT